MKFQLPILFWIVLVLFILHQFTNHLFQLSIPFLDDYFDPFCASILGLYGVRKERRYLSGNRRINLKWYEIALIVFYIAIISEEILPRLNNEFVKDYFDYVSFTVGGIIFYAQTNWVSFD